MNKILRSVGLVTAFAVATGANAQTPDNDIWPSGVTFTDINSNVIDCDAILDAGQSILIDAFADWCGPCWSYHTGGTLENLYNSVGNGGTGEVFIVGIESDPSVPESYITDSGTGMGDWSLGGTLDYPLANDNALAGIINLAYYPTLILICPDRTVTEVGQVSQSAWESAIGNCGGPATLANDPKILSTTTPSTVQVCGSTTGSTDITVVIQNFSTSTINGTYTIEVDDGSTVVATTNANLNLAPYDVQEVTVGSVPLNIGSNNFTATITTANDDASNDALPISVNLAAAQDVDVDATTLEVEVVLDIDGYPSEVGFALREGTPASDDPLAVWNSSNAGNSVLFVNDGTLSGSYNNTINLNSAGCHYFVTYDDYGDGITYAYPGGHAELNGITSMNIPGDWGDGGIWGVNFNGVGGGGGSGLEDSQILSGLSIYPNPAVDMTNIQLTLNESAKVTIELVNTLGQVVSTEYLGDVSGFQNVEINTSDLEEGMYLVNIRINDDVITKRISVIK